MYKPLAKDSLGSHSIEKANKDLLGKWLWRVGEPSQGLWRQLLLRKYNLDNVGWRMAGSDNKASGILEVCSFCEG